MRPRRIFALSGDSSGTSDTTFSSTQSIGELAPGLGMERGITCGRKVGGERERRGRERGREMEREREREREREEGRIILYTLTIYLPG